jgi:hypothetical protein
MADSAAPDIGPQEVPEPDPDNPAGFLESDEAAKNTSDGGSTQTLLRLLRTHPFWDLYLRTSEYERLPFRGKMAYILDTLLRIIVTLAIIGIALGIAWKTLAPFSHF